MKRFLVPAAIVLATAIVLVVILVGLGTLPVTGSLPVVGTPIATATDGAQVVHVQAAEMQFAPNAIVVRVGQPVQLTLENRGQRFHDFTLPEGPAQPVRIPVQPGQLGTATFTFEHPGTYTFMCSQAFHEAQGMKGTIVVQ
jgi:plastocyanin